MLEWKRRIGQVVRKLLSLILPWFIFIYLTYFRVIFRSQYLTAYTVTHHSNNYFFLQKLSGSLQRHFWFILLSPNTLWVCHNINYGNSTISHRLFEDILESSQKHYHAFSWKQGRTQHCCCEARGTPFRFSMPTISFTVYSPLLNISNRHQFSSIWMCFCS